MQGCGVVRCHLVMSTVTFRLIGLTLISSSNCRHSRCRGYRYETPIMVPVDVHFSTLKQEGIQPTRKDIYQQKWLQNMEMARAPLTFLFGYGIIGAFNRLSFRDMVSQFIGKWPTLASSAV